MDLLYAKAESSHAVEDLIRGLDPSEGRVAVVVRVDVREDGRSELHNARVRSAVQGLLGEQPEEALHEVEPRRVRRREMKLHPRMAQHPSRNERRLVCRQIVQDDMDVDRRLDARLNLAQKGDKVLRAMLGLAPGHDLARGDVERREEIE